MSSFPEAADAAADVQTEALKWLRGRSNPFVDLVRPQRPDERFRDLHVPDLLREPRELLQAIIDSYRVSEYRCAADLPGSRVVTIAGVRGSGKTHMLEALAHRDDGPSQLLVRPTYLDTEVSFEEFVRDQLVHALLSEDPVHGGRPFLDVAAQLTRRILGQALRELGPTDRLFFAGLPSSGRLRRRLLWGTGETTADRCRRLADDLLEAGDLPAQVARYPYPAEALALLAASHIRRNEPGEEPLSAVRQQLYVAMVRAALHHDGDALGRFLEADYRGSAARPFFRADVIRQQVHALVEACALVRLPVVIALDNLEGAVTPGGQFQPAAAIALLDNLAQLVDATRGLLILLFAETGLYREIRKVGHRFALDRIDQGVPLYGRGPVDVIELRLPGPEEIVQLIARRIQPLLHGFTGAERLPPEFPFGKPFLATLAGRTAITLRQLLRFLQEEYGRAVFNRTVPPSDESPPLVDWNPLLEQAWTEKLAAADRKLQDPLASHAAALHAGLRRLLQLAGPQPCGPWRPSVIRPLETTDGHSVYNHLTGIDWLPSGTDGPAAPIRVAVGFLLARGPGLPRDLKAKLAPVAETDRQPDCLTILWPRTYDGPLEEALSESTQSTWKKGTRKLRGAAIRPLLDDDLRKLLALPDWAEALQGAVDGPAPAALLQGFVRQRCQSILAATLPPLPETRSDHAN